MIRLLIALLWFSLPVPLQAATYYISTSGSDTSTSVQAQSKTTPWAHVRGMPSATSNAAAYVPVAGDVFVFKGGETWGTTNFPIKWAWSGTSGSRIHLTVDQTWFSGASWTRPIWDGEDTVTTTLVVGVTSYAMWLCDFGVTTCQYITISNMEITRFRWDGAPANGYCAQINMWGTFGITLDQAYIHDWTHGAATVDCFVAIGQAGADTSSFIQNSVIDGTRDVTGTIGSGLLWLVNNTINNYVTNISGMALPAGPGVISGNTFALCTHSFVVLDHNNWIESLGLAVPSADFDVVIKNNYYGGPSNNGCESMLVGNDYEQLYVFNNVIWDLSSNAPALGQNFVLGTDFARTYFYNNTIVAPISGQPCLRTGSGTMILIEYKNNHCITSGIDPGTLTGTTVNIATNLTQTLAVANGQGYSNVQTYKYAPTDSSDSTVDAGTNLTASCIGVLADLCSDTTYGVTLNTSNHTVSQTRTALARPQGSAWDIGAYEYEPSTPSTHRFSHRHYLRRVDLDEAVLPVRVPDYLHLIDW